MSNHEEYIKSVGEAIGASLAAKYPNTSWREIDRQYAKPHMHSYGENTLIAIDEYARLKFLEITKGLTVEQLICDNSSGCNV